MCSLVNSNFNRTYNPTGRQNALSAIKRLLTSRDTEAQNKACGYIVEVVSRYGKSSQETSQLVEYLLDNDITVFLCEAMSNLDFSLFRSILSCLRLLWRSRRFFVEEHAAHSMTAVLRALAHYAASDSLTAVDACLHFLCDLLNGISTNETTSTLSHQSAYSAVQLLACLQSLAPRINTIPNTVLSSAIVLHSLIAYQPDGLDLNGSTCTALVEVLNQWFLLLMGALNHSMLTGDEKCGLFLLIICQIGIEVLRLIKLLQCGKQKADFVHAILADDQEIAVLRQCAVEMSSTIQRVMSELVVFVKENQNQISTEEYEVFLKFLLNFLYENKRSEMTIHFCDLLFAKGYLAMLPQAQIVRLSDVPVSEASSDSDDSCALSVYHLDGEDSDEDKRWAISAKCGSGCGPPVPHALCPDVDSALALRSAPVLALCASALPTTLAWCEASPHGSEQHQPGRHASRTLSAAESIMHRYIERDSIQDVTVRKVSTLVLGELLTALAQGHLDVDAERGGGTCARDIHMGLVELQYGIEKPQNIGTQLQKSQPYSLLIYIYFYCQSSDNPEEATGSLLPYLVEHILCLPKSFKPPGYIIKAIWLVFAMSTISNGSLDSLDQRVYLEKANDRLVELLHPEPSVYYTHNPAILLWAFTSQRIPQYVRIHVLCQWLKTEDSLPEDLTTEPIVWELLLTILTQRQNQKVTSNCMEVLHASLEVGDDEDRQEFARMLWGSLPGVLSKELIDYDCDTETNICYLLDIATTLLPLELEQATCLKIAVLITTIFSKTSLEHSKDVDRRYHYEYVCLKLCLYLLGLANEQNDNKVLLTYINRAGFLPSVLTATSSPDDRVACAALQLLSCLVQHFTKNNYQLKSILQIQTHLIIKSLRRDSASERGSSLLELVYMLLNTGRGPLALSCEVEEGRHCDALRALMFRIQLMLCCRDSNPQSLAGWKTINSIFKYAIVYKNDPKLVETLTSQPWTHVLIQYQLTQNITEEFLTFAKNWLTLLKVTLQKNYEQKRVQMCKFSLVMKTMMNLKKSLAADGELKDMKENVLVIVGDILNLSSVRYN